jgi:exodeoxyribonuclease VII small subunit
MSFERGLSELENIVDQMQDDSTSLEDAMQLFEKGTKIINFCNNELTKAEAKLQELTQDLPQQQNP